MKRTIAVVAAVATWSVSGWLTIVSAAQKEGISVELAAEVWTPRQSISLRAFRQFPGSLGTPVGVAFPSPSGERFFTIAERGNIDCDCYVSELQIFSTSDVVRALKQGSGRAPASMRTLALNLKEGIVMPSWVGDESIVFHGRESGAVRENKIFAFSVISGDLKVVSQFPAEQDFLGVSGVKGAIVYHTQEVAQRTESEYPIYPITAQMIRDYVSTTSLHDRIVRTYVSYEGGKPWSMKTGYVPAGYLPWFAPDGKRAVFLRRQVSTSTFSNADGTAARRDLGQFWLVDLEHQNEELLLDIPVPQGGSAQQGAAPQAFWSEDGRSVVLVNAMPPERDVARLQAEAVSPGYIVSYDVASRTFQTLQPLQPSPSEKVKDVSWRKAGSEFLIRYERDGRPAAGLVYSYSGATWLRRSMVASDKPAARFFFAGGISVELRQSANDAPSVVASLNKREVNLSTPDSTLKEFQLARTAPFQWRDSGGAVRTAGLRLPKALSAGDKKIPLVIQIYNYEPNVFHPDGPFTTGFAAQSLVAQGMAVLTMDGPWHVPSITGTAQEGPLFIDWVETASEALAQKYPIDLGRIGLVGFSRSGYMIRYALTHPRRLRFGAAVAADSVSQSYFTLLVKVAQGLPGSMYDNAFGGPFYQAKASWLQEETSFNIDKVQTPILFVDNGLQLIWTLDTIGSFKLARKPFDYMMIGSPFHELYTPATRAASQEATVDWLNFWLQGREDPRSEKTDRFARWRAQRELQKLSTTDVSQLAETATTKN